MRGRTSKRLRSYATLVALLGGLIAFPQAPRAISQEAIRIMPLGDSITEGKNGHATYRYFLWQDLLEGGYGVDFVGTQDGVSGGQPRYPEFDQDHEGHSGFRADKVALGVRAWVTQTQAEVVLVHLGTNDVLKGQRNSSTRRDLANVIDEMRIANPQVRILLAEIIPIQGKESIVQDLNLAIRALAGEKHTAASPVIAVDQFTGFNVTSDLYDGVHPSESGYAKLAARWYAALTGLFGDVSQPTSVMLTEPQAGAVFAPGSVIPIKATVTGDRSISKVVFLGDGIPLGEDTTTPYEIAWTSAGNGQVEIRADAHEEGGSVISSATLSITVGEPPDESEVLLVVSNPVNPSSSDLKVVQRLETLGLSVTLADDDGITTGAASGKALVIISASVSSGRVGTAFTTAPVPLLTWEAGLFDDLGMTGRTSGVDFGETGSTDLRTTISVADPTHPLASGLAGNVIVSNPATRFMWGLPSDSAALVATIENEPTKYAVFGYEAGAAMVSGTAPARRVALFLHATTPSTLTANGWVIFDASVTWAAGG